MYLVFILLFFCLSGVAARAEDVLDAYVRQGLADNLALQQKTTTLEQSLQALREARGLFYPALTFSARYSRAGGGRDFVVPVGDLINPVHQTLNQLLGQPVFPGNLANEHIPFLREKEQDTRVRITQPLFQPDVYYNHKIQREHTHIRQAEGDAFARELVRDIKAAYFNHLKALHLVALLDDTQGLLDEHLRVSQKLVDAGKATPDVVYRARAEQADLRRQQAEVRRDSALTAAYFNFLLNRAQDASIEADFPDTPVAIPDLETAQQRALAHRGEFQQLHHASRIAGYAVALSKSAYLPQVAFVYDYGIEGETYTFDSTYWMASVVLNWNVFDGFQKQARIKQHMLELHKLELRQGELERHIALDVYRAHENVTVALKAVEAATESAESARQSFRMVRRKYEEGLAPHVAFLDARTAHTRAEVQRIIAMFDAQIHRAELERSAAMYPINR